MTTKFNIDQTVNTQLSAIKDGITLSMEFLKSEAIQTTEGKRGIELRAVDTARLKNSYATETQRLTGYLGNLTDYYVYVHFGTAEGKPGQTQPRPILSLVLDRNIKNIVRIITKSLSKV